MICSRCKKVLPDESLFCMFCGKKLHKDRSEKKRANGEGYIYKRGEKFYIRITIGSEVLPSGKKRLLHKYKGGFTTKIEALNYLKTLKQQPDLKKPKNLQAVYEDWKKVYEDRITKHSMDGYRGAFNHYRTLWDTKVDKITARRLQECLNKCPAGKRTKQLMKVIANLLFKYAIDEQMVTINPAANLYVGNDPTTSREPITEKELEVIAKAFETEPYAKYIYALCYLGYRPTEFLRLTKSDFHFEDGVEWLIGGMKTDAGRDRAVTVPPKISWIIHERLDCPDSEYLFPKYGKKDGKASLMSEEYFRKHVFYPLMERLGIEGKVPYSTRHTYSNKIKNVQGADRDKAALIGHSDYKTTQKFYQSTDLEDRKKITDKLQ